MIRLIAGFIIGFVSAATLMVAFDLDPSQVTEYVSEYTSSLGD